VDSGADGGESATIEHLRSELAAKQATVDTLLKGFVATDFPVVAGLAFDVLYQPAAAIEQLGGDWYDIFMLPDGRVAFRWVMCAAGPRRGGQNGSGEAGNQSCGVAAINDPMPIAVLDQANKPHSPDDTANLMLSMSQFAIIDK